MQFADNILRMFDVGVTVGRGFLKSYYIAPCGLIINCVLGLKDYFLLESVGGMKSQLRLDLGLPL